jgi:hypothetical protein
MLMPFLVVVSQGYQLLVQLVVSWGQVVALLGQRQ